MRWKVPAAVVLLAVGAGAVVLAVTGGPGGSRASEPQYLTATAATADIADTVVADGSLVRATTYDLNFGVAPTVEDVERHRRRAATGPGRSPRSRSRSATPSRRATSWRRADTTSLERQLRSAKVEPGGGPEPADDRQGDSTTTPRDRRPAPGPDRLRQRALPVHPGPGPGRRPRGADRPGDDRRPGRRHGRRGHRGRRRRYHRAGRRSPWPAARSRRPPTSPRATCRRSRSARRPT